MWWFLAEDEEGDEGGSILMDDEIWSALPLEIMFTILARLPLSSFLRFRAVCKQWNALLRNPSSSPLFSSPPAFYNKPCAIFKSNHSSLTFRHTSQLSVQPFPQTRKWMKCIYLHGGAEEGGQIRLRWRQFQLDFLRQSDNLVSSHSGLLLVQRGAAELLVCNPLLQVWRQLPVLHLHSNFPVSTVVSRFLNLTAIYGMNPVSTSFKVIWAPWYRFAPPVRQSLPSLLYNSANHKWRRIEGRPFFYPAIFENNGTFCNNICYWATRNLDILAFDFEQEVWHILKTKWVPESDPPNHYGLWEWQGHLMMITHKNMQIMLCQLSENNEWNEFDIPISGMMIGIRNRFLPIRFTCMGNILLVANAHRKKVLAYNVVSKDLIISDKAHDSSILFDRFVSFHPNLEAHWS